MAIKKDEKTAMDTSLLDPDVSATEADPVQIINEREEAERGDPLWMIAHEIFLVGRDGKRSAERLRKLINDVYPKSSKEESMRFLASMTRMWQAAEVAQQAAKDVHASVLNQPW